MIINSTIQTVASAYARTGAVKQNRPGASDKVEARDEIQLSSQAQNFSAKLNKLQASKDEVRADKVTYYENLIASGAYNVSSKDLADKLIASRF